MPRQPRLVVVGYPHHVIFRGNNRSAIFHNEKDRRFFVACARESKNKAKSKIYSYCLMVNHVHLLVVPSTKEGLKDMMQSLGRRYVQYVNRTYKRTGTLWEGRFKSSVVSTDEYLLACSRYIELNPVRAKIVKHPKEYHWSSYGCKAEGRPDRLLDEDPMYLDLGKTPQARQAEYKNWFRKSISDDELQSIRRAIQKGSPFVSEKCFDKIVKLAGRNIAVRPRRRPKKSL